MTESIRLFWLEKVQDNLFRRTDTGEQMLLRDVPPGGVWNADWLQGAADAHLGDGQKICLVVRLPNNHDWMPGMGAANCTRKGEDHDCWGIHGSPPNIHVNKNPLPGRTTCNAGAGSIQSGRWHGFIEHGHIVTR